MISQPQKMKSESKKDRSARRQALLSALLGGLLHGLLCFFLSDFIFSPFFSYALTQIAIVLGWLLIAGTGVLLLFRPREKILLRSLLHFGGFFFFFLLKILFLRIEIFPLGVREINNADGLLILIYLFPFLAGGILIRLGFLLTAFCLKMRDKKAKKEQKTDP